MTENQISVIEAAIDYTQAAETGRHKRSMESILIAAVGDLLAEYDGDAHAAMNDLELQAFKGLTNKS
jgi:hypothetical protein